MKRICDLVLLSSALVLFLAMGVSGAVCSGEENPAYVRVQQDAQGNPLALQTLIRRFQKKSAGRPVVVDLVAVVHIAERAYYADIDRRLGKYDAVLYELIAPKDHSFKHREDDGGQNPLSLFQSLMGKTLGLESQLDGIDYNRPNFVHADMTPQEFEADMKQRGDSFGKLALRAMIFSAARQGDGKQKPPDLQSLLLVISDRGRAAGLKRLIAQEFADMEMMVKTLEGKDGSTLVHGRNSVAITQMENEISRGRRSLAIFYGGAHMSNFEERLCKLGFAPYGDDWLTAWNLKGP